VNLPDLPDPPVNYVNYLPPAAQAASTGQGDPVRGRELASRVVAVKGGLAKLKGVRTVVAEAKTTLRMQQGPLESITRTYVVYPDKFRVDASVGGANVVQVYNSGDAWMTDPNGTRDAPAPMKSEFATSVRRDMIPLLIDAAEGRLVAKLLPDEGRDGRALRVLEISGEGVPPVRLYVDAEGLVARQSFSREAPDGGRRTADEAFSDYRDIDGIKVPFTAQLTHDGRPVLTRVLTDVKFNTPVDLKLFSRPSPSR
jgi:hypothetical protein